MNTDNDVLIRRLNLLIDRYEMRKTGKSYFAVKHKRESVRDVKITRNNNV